MQPYLPLADTPPMVPRDTHSGQNGRAGLQRSTFASKGIDLAMYADLATMVCEHYARQGSQLVGADPFTDL